MQPFALRQTSDELDQAIEQAVAQADGDLRSAIRDLARRQHDFGTAITGRVSAGYARRGLKR